MLELNTIEQGIANGTLEVTDLKNIEISLTRAIEKIKEEITIVAENERNLLMDELFAFQCTISKIRCILNKFIPKI